MAETVLAHLERLKKSREKKQTDIVPVFTELGEKGKQSGYFSGYEVHNGNDVHGLYTLSVEVAPPHYPGHVVLHLQGYPGFSKNGSIMVSARIRDQETMLREREKRRASIGNEHGSNIAFIWGASLREMPYDADVILSRLVGALKNLEYSGDVKFQL